MKKIMHFACKNHKNRGVIVPRGILSHQFTPFVRRAGFPSHMPTQGGGRSAPYPWAIDKRPTAFLFTVFLQIFNAK
jgi:hypothetical protein